MQAAAVYDTYCALPADGAAHTATDVALLAEILKAAEAELDAAGQGVEQQVSAGWALGGAVGGCWVACCDGAVKRRTMPCQQRGLPPTSL